MNNHDENPTVKPCKVCNSIPEIASGYKWFGMAVVHCKKCNIITIEATASTEEDAIKKAIELWNIQNCD